ncbi:50S ribosomal protein L9 [Acidobacteria bacterium Mor1]|nr:50S ribosomal protein L9 [Acidobacteria bacterium Mor1]
MKVVLRENVEKLGSRGDVVSVANGYARNYLLPRGLALEATSGNLKTIESQRRSWAVKEAKEAEEARAMAARLAEVEVTISKRAGENDTLYGSVTSSEIAEVLAEKGVAIDRRKLQLAEPIKALGTVEVPLKLHPEVTGTIKVNVVPEQIQASEQASEEA